MLPGPHNGGDHRLAGMIVAADSAPSAVPVDHLGAPGMGAGWVASSLQENGVSSISEYQANAPIDDLRDEGNCGGATSRVEEAWEEMRKRRVCLVRTRMPSWCGRGQQRPRLPESSSR